MTESTDQGHSAGRGKLGLGCLLVALLVGALVSGLFVATSVIAAVLDLTGVAEETAEHFAEPARTPWLAMIPVFLFAAPMFVLFARGCLVVVEAIRDRPRRPLVTQGLAWMLAFAYGVPGIVGLAALIVLGSDEISLDELVSGAVGLVFLCSAPFALGRAIKPSPPR